MPLVEASDMEMDKWGRYEAALVNCDDVAGGRLSLRESEEMDGGGREESVVRESGRASFLLVSSGSMPGRMESGWSSGHRADLMHCSRVIIIRQAGT